MSLLQNHRSRPPLKVLHIVGGDLKKGAYRGAFWLHQGLIEHGVDSRILGFIPLEQRGPLISGYSSDFGGQIIDRLFQAQGRITNLFYPKKSSLYQASFFGRRCLSTIKQYNFDVLHVHWLSNGVISIPMLKNIGKPVVLTLRDMWPFTGGCHYSLDCDAYTRVCGKCPQLGSKSKKDLSILSQSWKRKHLKSSSISVVGISDWISQCARESRVFGDSHVTSIPNGIDTSLFQPVRRELARKVLGLSNNEKIILVGAGNLKSNYKGWPEFVEAVQLLSSLDFHIVTFGNIQNSDELKNEENVTHLGYLHDELSLRIAYSAADVFVAPSTQEAFGKTLVESMSCGTPVACFDATGPKDIVIHKVTGYKAKAFCSSDLAKGISWLLSASNIDQIRIQARKHAQSTFAKEIIARQYIQHYLSIIDAQPVRSTRT